MRERKTVLGNLLVYWAQRKETALYVCQLKNYHKRLDAVPQEVSDMYTYNVGTKTFTNNAGGKVRVVAPDDMAKTQGVKISGYCVDEAAE